MTREDAIAVLNMVEAHGSLVVEAKDMAIKALEIVEEFEKAQIITGGRLNGRTYAYKCGLEDGKRKALEQEPSEDCVSRQVILNKIKEVCFSEDWLQFRVDNGSNGQRDFLINYIEQLPPVTPTQKWIPVTEDAPPKGTICLWCNKQRSVFASEITYRTERNSYVGKHGYFSNGLENYGNIVAWMSLPEPYKAESEG